MTLADILTARAASARATAAVDCGALGSVTVEALPLRELERFSSGPDGDRGIFYAACRELQQAGQQLFDKGKTVRPDGVTAFLSDSEARLAADTVRRLSGWTAVTQADDALELSGSAPDQESEVRLSSVQKNSPEQDAEDEVRLESVQENLPEQDDEGEIQPEAMRENSTEQDVEGEVQPEAMWENSSEQNAEDGIQPEAVQENSSEQNAEDEIRPEAVRENSSEQDTEGEIRPEVVRENSSEQDDEGEIQPEAMRENSSEQDAEGEIRPESVRQNLSERDAEGKIQPKPVRQNLSEQDAEGEIPPEPVQKDERDFSEVRQNIVQQIAEQRLGGEASREFPGKDSKKTHFPDILDKTQKILPASSFRAQDMEDRAEDTLHEIKPKYAEKTHLNLHETESESAERIARQLLEGLRQASWVR